MYMPQFKLVPRSIAATEKKNCFFFPLLQLEAEYEVLIMHAYLWLVHICIHVQHLHSNVLCRWFFREHFFLTETLYIMYYLCITVPMLHIFLSTLH